MSGSQVVIYTGKELRLEHSLKGSLSLLPVEKTPVHRSNQSESKLSIMAKTKEHVLILLS